MVKQRQPGRILMLVPHDPQSDPRVQWVAGLCSEVAWTEIVGAIPEYEGADRDLPVREYDGRCYTVRIKLREAASWVAKQLARVARSAAFQWPVRRWRARQQDASGAVERRTMPRRFAERVRQLQASVLHCAGAWASFNLIVSALYRYGRAVSVIPRVVICHDVFALAAGVKIKKLLGCPLIYDAHEFWPEANVVVAEWEKKVMTVIERRLVKNADVVVTVNPHLASHLAGFYGLSTVVSAPNAAPLEQRVPPPRKAGATPVKFLFQGGAAGQRGIEELLDAWREIGPEQAVLYLRCPENGYFRSVKDRYRDVIEQKQVVLLDAVKERDLVREAVFADVGVIPYLAVHLNHVLCCPNKLSQYMQAGLAILSNELRFVAETIARYRCGMTYRADEPGSLVAAVRSLVNDPQRLETMQRNAYVAAQQEYNWERQSGAYAAAIRELYGRP